MLTTDQLEPFFPDLSDERVAVGAGARALALLDQHVPVAGRWPTRTASSPTTARSTPSRATATGCAPARRCSTSDLHPRRPRAASSRSAPRAPPTRRRFDEVLELLHLGGRSLPHAVLMMIPEAWENHDDDGPGSAGPSTSSTRSLMEPWDGPAVDRVHRRHARSARCSTATACARRATGSPTTASSCMASEVGVLDIDPATVVQQGPAAARAGCSSSTPTQGRIVERRGDQGRRSPPQQPYGEWLHAGLVHLDDLPEREHIVHTPRLGAAPPADLRLHRRGAARSSLAPMASTGAEAIGSMGTDTPDRRAVATGRGCCSTTSRSCSRRSPTRRSTRSARSWSPRSARTIGPEGNLLDPAPASCRQVVLPFPVIDNDELAKIVHINARRRPARASRRTSSRGLYRVAGGGEAPARARSTRSAPRSSQAIADGARIIVLSDRDSDRRARADPVAAAHRGGAPPPGPREDPHPGRPGRRGRRRPRGAPHRAAHRLRRRPRSTRTSLGDRRGPRPRRRATSGRRPREGRRQPHQGARQGRAQGDVQDGHLHGRVLHAARRSSRRSACRRTLVDEYFTGTRQPARRHRPRRASPRRSAAPPRRAPTRRRRPTSAHRELERRRRVPVAPRGRAAPVQPRDGVPAAALHARRGRYDIFKQYTAARRRPVRAADDAARPVRASRTPAHAAAPVPIEEVEPVSEIVKRFSTGAMRYGSISPGGARDPRDRDEPPRRQVQHRRGRRGRRPPATTPSARSARSSRSPRAASA